MELNRWRSCLNTINLLITLPNNMMMNITGININYLEQNILIWNFSTISLHSHPSTTHPYLPPLYTPHSSLPPLKLHPCDPNGMKSKVNCPNILSHLATQNRVQCGSVSKWPSHPLHPISPLKQHLSNTHGMENKFNGPNIYSKPTKNTVL